MEFLRLIGAECLKMRRTILPLIHVSVPVAVSILFLGYYSFAPWSEQSQISVYVEVLGVALPFLISMICAAAVELETENHFQVFLGVVQGRKRVLAAKWLVLLGLGLFALSLAVGIFAAGYYYLLGKNSLTLGLCVTLTGVLWVGSISLYMWHLFLNLRFSKTISMGIGIGETLISALFLTGLGDGRWQYVPAGFSARGSSELLYFRLAMQTGNGMTGELLKKMECCLLITVLLCVIIFLWFQFYEGRVCDD